MHSIIAQLAFQILIQVLRIVQRLVFVVVHVRCDYVVAVHPAIFQMPGKQFHQQVGFSAAPYARDGFHKTAVLHCNQFVQVFVAFYFHVI